MKQATSVDSLKDSEFICIDVDSEIFNGYILDTFESEPGIMTIILSHDSEFYDEDLINITYDTNTGEILHPTVYLHDQ